LKDVASCKAGRHDATDVPWGGGGKLQKKAAWGTKKKRGTPGRMVRRAGQKKEEKKFKNGSQQWGLGAGSKKRNIGNLKTSKKSDEKQVSTLFGAILLGGQ